MHDRTPPDDQLEQFQQLWEQRIARGEQRIAQMPAAERPREKLLARGPKALSDLELMAVLLGKGTRSADVFALAARVLRAINQDGSQPNPDTLLEIPGIGPAKATLISAAMELARRRIHPSGFRISWPPEVLPYIRYLDFGHFQEKLEN